LGRWSVATDEMTLFDIFKAQNWFYAFFAALGAD
jgi:hypothetical protein